MNTSPVAFDVSKTIVIDECRACGTTLAESPSASQTRKAAYTALYQSHLPKLDDTGVIEYDHRPNILTPGSHFATVRTYLDAIDRTHPAHDTEPGNRPRAVQNL